MTVVVK